MVTFPAPSVFPTALSLRPSPLKSNGRAGPPAASAAVAGITAMVTAMVSSVAAAVNLMVFLQAGTRAKIFGYSFDVIRHKEVRQNGTYRIWVRSLFLDFVDLAEAPQPRSAGHMTRTAL